MKPFGSGSFPKVSELTRPPIRCRLRNPLLSDRIELCLKDKSSHCSLDLSQSVHYSDPVDLIPP